MKRLDKTMHEALPDRNLSNSTSNVYGKPKAPTPDLEENYFREEQPAHKRQVLSAGCTKRDIFGDTKPEIVDLDNTETRHLLIALQHEQKERYKEIKANTFAAELLMPMEECKRIEYEYEGASAEDLILAVMTRFGVTRAAATIRIEELQLGVVEGGLW